MESCRGPVRHPAEVARHLLAASPADREPPRDTRAPGPGTSRPPSSRALRTLDSAAFGTAQRRSGAQPFTVAHLERWPMGAERAELLDGQLYWPGNFDERDAMVARRALPGSRIRVEPGVGLRAGPMLEDEPTSREWTDEDGTRWREMNGLTLSSGPAGGTGRCGRPRQKNGDTTPGSSPPTALRGGRARSPRMRRARLTSCGMELPNSTADCSSDLVPSGRPDADRLSDRPLRRRGRGPYAARSSVRGAARRAESESAGA